MKYFIRLLAAAVRQTVPPEPDGEVDFRLIYDISKFHDVANTVFYAVERLKNKPEPELYKKWRDERNIGFHRYIVQQDEYNKITELFSAEGIDYTPMKGFAISKLYPAPEYRFMSDLDFLLRRADLKRAGALIKGMGYTVETEGALHHDEFIKPPFMLVELHHEMVGVNSRFHDYYTDIFDRARKVGEHSFALSDEDSYIFQLVHLNKHYEESGTGIRSVVDIYLFNEKKGESLDWAYIDREFARLGLTDFHRMITGIGKKWINDADVESFSDEEKYLLQSGSYGTDAQKYLNRKGDMKTGRFLLTRFFPPVGRMKYEYAVLRKCVLLLPAVYVYRIFHGLIVHQKQIKDEIKVLKEDKKNNSGR